MRDRLFFWGLAAALAMFTAGCFTRATAYTKRTPDGTTLSRVSVVGTGDKASQIAAEGLFADGADEDLAAGVHAAQASQESSGIQGTLAGLGALLQGLAQFSGAYQAGAPAFGGVSGGEPARAQDLAPRSVVSGEGAAIVILGDRSSCVFSRRLWEGLDAEALASATAMNVIDADKTAAPAVYAAHRPASAFLWPTVIVLDADGREVQTFLARNMSQDDLTLRVGSR